MESPEAGRRGRAALLALFLVALAVRVVGLDFDQGHFYHPDERAIGDAVTRLSFRPLQLNPHFFAYGSFPLYVIRVVSSAAAAALRRPELATYDGAIRTGRLLSALWGAATVLLLARLGRRWYGERAGLLAGAFLGLAVLHVQTSHFASTDVALTFLVLLALDLTARLATSGRPRDALLAGAVTGLALATKASAAPLLLPLAVAAFLAARPAPRPALRALGLLAAATVATFVFFALGEPYAFLDAKEFWRSVSEQGAMVRHAGLMPYTNQYVGLPHFLYEGKEFVLWGVGPLLGLAALCATARRLLRPRALAPYEWILASFLVPYALLTCTFQVKFPRYLLPIYPILLLWAGGWLAARASEGRLGRFLERAVLLGTALWAAAFLSIYMRPHSAVTASRWFHEHVPDGARVLEQDWDEGFPFTFPGRAAERYSVLMFGFYEPDSPAKMEKLAGELAKADWVALQTKRLYGGVSRAPDKFPLTNRAFRLLFAGDLGFVLEKEVASRPALFGLEIPDELADESFSVYDHPKALLFRNEKRLDAATLTRLLETGTPSRFFSRNDLLLARPGRVAASRGAAEEDAPPGVRASLPALVFFAGFLELLGLAGYALLARALPERPGLYALAKVLGVLAFAFGAWLLAACRLVPFQRGALAAWALLLLAAAAWAARGRPFRAPLAERGKTELVTWGAFLFFAVFRALTPEIFFGEKPMDFAFLNTLLRTEALPPPEPWLAGATLSYTYFGHFLVAALGKTLGIAPSVLFNLGIAGTAALAAAGVLAAGAALGGRLRAGAVAVVFALFWAPTSGVREAVLRLRDHRPLDWHYFWATSRVIAPNGINEYPLWSFLFADLHAHVLALPLAAAFLAVLLLWVTRERPAPPGSEAALVFLLGLLLAAIQITNGWSLPVYGVLLVFLPLLAFLGAPPRGAGAFLAGAAHEVLFPAAGTALVAAVLSRPFWAHFTPPPRNFGREAGPWATPWDFANVWAFFLALLVPLLFAALQASDATGAPPSRARRVVLGLAACALPLTLLRLGLKPPRVEEAVSSGFFTGLACLLGFWACLSRRTPPAWRPAAILTTYGLAILTGCEVVFVWDRMNTIFKFHFETWLLFSVAGAAALAALVSRGGLAWKAAAGATGAVALFTALTAVPAYLRKERGGWPTGTLDGTAYLAQSDPGDAAAYAFLNAHVRGVPVLLEAQGPAYQEFSRYTTFTGLPTVQGWEYHTQQRGHSRAETDRRSADVTTAYTSPDADAVADVLKRYHVALVVVGPLERKTYAGANLARFSEWKNLLFPVYRNPDVTIFGVAGVYAPGEVATLVRVEELRAPAASEAAAPAAPPPVQPVGQVRQPRGIAVDRQGRVFVADFGNERVQVFSSSLAPLRAFGAHGAGPGDFADPCAVAVGADGLVYVADTWNERIQVLDEAGAYRRELQGGFFGPRGVAVDGAGRVYVADTGNGRIVRFGADGKPDRDWGKGDGPGHLTSPHGLAFAPDGRLWVADNDAGRLVCFTSDGAFVHAFEVAGWRRETYSEPSLAVDAKGTIWASVPLEGEVRGYAASGRLLATVSGKAEPEGQRFTRPTGLALLPGDRLAVADLEGKIVAIPLPHAR